MPHRALKSAIGVAQDYREAIKWFRLAAEQDTLEGSVRLLLVILVMLVGVSIQTSGQDVATELEVRQAKNQYLDCLSVETARVVPRKLSQKDFLTFIKSACLNEQSLFRNALIKLFSRHRNTGQGAVYEATVDGVIAAS